SDFVAKNDLFVEFVKAVAEVVAKENPADLEALMACKYPGSDKSVQDMQNEKVLVIGENIKVRRFARYAEGYSVPYIHAGGKIGVIVNMAVEGFEAEKAEELGKDIAMQIAAMNPAFLDKANVDAGTINKEKEILMAQIEQDPKNANKPQNIKEKMIEGRISKYYSENCLMQQEFVKGDKISVEKHVAEVAKSLGGKITVCAFTRFEKGEGIEKKQENFAEEIASLVK
ncbi:MAG: translation elongation factor Ts, partial [Oscillospiraceae bacterium]|nr:translation elongation factor Ts [Oscillospiraceae bacterium]